MLFRKVFNNTIMVSKCFVKLFCILLVFSDVYRIKVKPSRLVAVRNMILMYNLFDISETTTNICEYMLTWGNKIVN